MKKISIISNEYSISIRTLHYYDSIGLLIPYRKNGIRLYSTEDEARLKMILIYKETGLSLEEIIEILSTNNFEILHKRREYLINKRNKINEMITYIDGIELLKRHPQSTYELENPFNTPIRQIIGDEHLNENYSKYASNNSYKNKLELLIQQFHESKHNKTNLQNFILNYYEYMNNDLHLNLSKRQFKDIIEQGLTKSNYFNESDTLIFSDAIEEFVKY